jgi:dihydrofolate reductase
MLISAIVATAKNGVIGKDNEIPWYLPADFAYFKRVTLNHHIIMGRNCYDSIGRPLPKRTNIIVTRNPFFIASGCITVHSIAEGLQMAKQNEETEVFIIGGGEIYKQTMAILDKIYLTEVDLETEGDVFFPDLEANEWKIVSEEHHPKDDKNEWDFTFKIYERI